MIKIVKGDKTFCKDYVAQLKSRIDENDKKVDGIVYDIIKNVKENGDEALKEYSLKFDGWVPEKIELSKEEIAEIAKESDPKFIEALEKAAANIEDFHKRQKQQSRIDTDKEGVILGQKVRGLHSVGVYVPGGTATYPSTVLMNVIPAKIAEVGEIVMVTPPGMNGKPDAGIMAAAMVAGVDRVFLVGGAQAVAGLAYGTKTLPKVDKIVGPGNIFVATAKKQLYGVVDIDMIAGPSEVLIIADKKANPKYLAADLMSQAEHDKMASSVLITDSEELAVKTKEELIRQVKTLSRKDIIEESLENFGAIIVCEDMNQAVEFANDFAPEHLEVSCENPFDYLGKLHNAGSIFLGEYSPEPLGDYFAGPNHVLPTNGTARFFSPLSVDSYLKKTSFIYYTKEALSKVSDEIILLAKTEQLTAHANSIEVRQEDV